MKCPMCDGTGKSEIGVGAFTIHGADCDRCNGKGVIEPMTNDEWRRTCSTEEFAEWITELSELCTIRYQCELCDGWCDEKRVVEWLKEIHNDIR